MKFEYSLNFYKIRFVKLKFKIHITSSTPAPASYPESSAVTFYPSFVLSAFPQSGVDFELSCRGSAGDKEMKL